MNDLELNQWFLASGSEEALALLVQRHYSLIRSYIYKILNDYQDADEITNDTFLKAFNDRKSIRDPDKFVGWLYATAKHGAIDRLRDRQRQFRQLSELIFIDNYTENVSETTSVSTLTRQNTQQIETYHYPLTGLLRLLSEKDRVLVDYLLDGQKPKQIAESIGSTDEAVQKRWERMREWLSPIAHNFDKLISDLSPQEQKIMERYLDNQSLEKISRNLGISPHDVEVYVKRVIKRWKKTVTQDATTKLNRGSN